MSLKVLQSGLWTSIQDRGRLGYAAYGVPISGAMDSYMAALANLLVGNNAQQAVLEITMQGPSLEIQKDGLMALSALQATIQLNGRILAPNKAFFVKAGDRLEILRITEGVRAYLAVKGGFKTAKKLGSRSFYKGITSSQKLEVGDEVNYLSFSVEETTDRAVLRLNKSRYDGLLEVFKGPEWNALPEVLKKRIKSGKFHISSINSRMAYQLTERLQNDLLGILTQPVLPGTVQLTPAGNIIVLMRDCQTTGGYPRILQLSEKAINQLAQQRVGDEVRFKIQDY